MKRRLFVPDDVGMIQVEPANQRVIHVKEEGGEVLRTWHVESPAAANLLLDELFGGDAHDRPAVCTASVLLARIAIERWSRARTSTAA